MIHRGTDMFNIDIDIDIDIDEDIHIDETDRNYN